MNRSSRSSRPTRTALLGIVVLLLTGCGAEGDSQAARTEPEPGDQRADQDEVEEPGSDDPVSEEVTESADDCEVTEADDTCDDTAPQDAGTEGDEGYAEMLADAAGLVGVTEDGLPEDVRIGRRGDERFALTEDYRVGRRTVELDQDASGAYVVTSVVLEAEGGPVRMPPEN